MMAILSRPQCVNHISFKPGDEKMCWWTGSSLDQIMAWRHFGAKPLSESMLTYCPLVTKEHISIECCLKFKSSHKRKCISKCSLWNVSHFVLASVYSRPWACSPHWWLSSFMGTQWTCPSHKIPQEELWTCHWLETHALQCYANIFWHNWSQDDLSLHTAPHTFIALLKICF